MDGEGTKQLVYDASTESSIIDGVWKAVLSWYAQGMKVNPALYWCPPYTWRRVCIEAGAQGNKQMTVGVKEVMTDHGARNALCTLSPVVGAWLWLCDPEVRQKIRVEDKDGGFIGEITVK